MEILVVILERMNFPQNWVDLLLDGVSTSKLSFVLNGKIVGSVVSSRGLRQGCPLSPYLFILYAESLSSLIQKSKMDRKALGVRCCMSIPLISYLFFFL